MLHKIRGRVMADMRGRNNNSVVCIRKNSHFFKTLRELNVQMVLTAELLLKHCTGKPPKGTQWTNNQQETRLPRYQSLTQTKRLQGLKQSKILQGLKIKC